MAAEVKSVPSQASSPNGITQAAAPAGVSVLEELMQAAAGLGDRPRAWVDVTSYPWADEAFSSRYVRRANYQELYGMKETGDEVEELMGLLNVRPKARILDLCSGNGRHSIAMALRGCKMTGLDVGPGAVALARETSRNLGLSVDYRQIDALTMSFEDAYDAVFLTCGGLSDFSPADAKDLVGRVERALVPGGTLCAEFSDAGAAPDADVRSWKFESADASLFADAAHLQLDERLFERDQKAEVLRSFVVTADGKMRQFARARQYYSEDEVKGLLGHLVLVGFATGSAAGLRRVTAKKP